jgi:3-oxoacyl-[acyl-carrier protein] reductase
MEEAEYGITANMICPGDITNEWKEKSIEESVSASIAKHTVGRQGTGEDIARVIQFLIGDQSDFITGSIIPVTGGIDVLGKALRT